MTLEERIRELVNETVKAAGRPDLFREPLCAFSAAGDARYEDLKTLVGPWVKSPRELLPDARSVISCFVPFTHGHSCVKIRLQPAPLCRRGALPW